MTRLENVTRRLERVPAAAQTQETAVQTSTPSPVKHSPLIPVEEISPQAKMSVEGYEDIIAGPVQQYLQLSQKIGGDVLTHSKLVQKAFELVIESNSLRDAYFILKISFAEFSSSSSRRLLRTRLRLTRPSKLLSWRQLRPRFRGSKSSGKKAGDHRSSIIFLQSVKVSQPLDGLLCPLRQLPT